MAAYDHEGRRLGLRPGAEAGVPYPLSVCSTRRYLTDQHGAPFLVHGDTAWSLISALRAEEVERYLADRQARGFNSIIVNLIEHKFNGPESRYGERPFANPDDFTTANEKYFQFADWCVEKAAEHGIQVFLAPIYLGYHYPAYRHQADDEGWISEVLANGPEKCRQWGRYAGQRYGKYDNIVWLIGGDRNPGEALVHVEAFVAGLREHDTRHLFCAHVAPESIAAAEYSCGGWLDLNATYTYEVVHRHLLADYNRQPTMPFVLIESTYEGEHNASDVQIRRQAYWALLCGAGGQFIGNRPIWGFFPGWEEALNSPASHEMVHHRALFTSRPWHDLVPDQDHSVVTAGLGEYRGLDYTAAARTSDGGTVIAYMPDRRAITVDMARVAGQQARGWWFDPRTGLATSIGEFPTAGLATLDPPTNGDWALVLDDASRNLPVPGT